MALNIKEQLKNCQHSHTALLATNFYNLETLLAIFKAAAEENVPIILQLTQSSIDYIGLDVAVSMARQGLKDYGLTGWIHLDHGQSVDLVHKCLDSGFDSVMIDASEKPFQENVEITAQVVEMAKAYNANVEAELGYIAKLGQQQEYNYTTVEDAVSFVHQTGVDALAIAIGSAHGFYKATPKLDIKRLSEIHNATDAILVLHGSSGIPDDMIKDAIRNGISKVNLATEIKDTFMKNLKETLMTTDEIDLRKVFPKATNSVIDLLRNKYNIVQT